MPINKSTLGKVFQWLALSNHLGNKIQSAKRNGNYNIGDTDTGEGWGGIVQLRKEKETRFNSYLPTAGEMSSERGNRQFSIVLRAEITGGN